MGKGVGLKILTGGNTSGFFKIVLPKLGISAEFDRDGFSSLGVDPPPVELSLFSFFLSIRGNENFCSGALHLLNWASGLF